MNRFAIPAALLIAGSLLAGCANTAAQYPTLANRCPDRPFEAGKCQQQSNFRLFGVGGPIIGDERGAQ